VSAESAEESGQAEEEGAELSPESKEQSSDGIAE